VRTSTAARYQVSACRYWLFDGGGGGGTVPSEPLYVVTGMQSSPLCTVLWRTVRLEPPMLKPSVLGAL
jgi:hypothetical protein